jgi:LysM repeat protein
VSGDSLSTIASRYRVSQQALISLNNLGNADHVEVGQRLRLPNNAVLPQPRVATPKPVPVKADPNATSHTVARGQTLTQIAKAYNISVRSLVDINDIGNPNAVDVGTKLLLRQPPQTSNAPLPTQSVQETGSTIKPTASDETSTPLLSSTGSGAEEPESTVMASSTTAKASANPAASAAPQEVDWRSYGPLKVDWGNWQTMAGSEVVPTLNGQGQPLYVAVNCDAQKINVTGANGAWKSWTSPQKDYEQDRVKDRCST